MFLGLFIVLASLLTLLEEFGYITANVKWGLPLAFACFGLSLNLQSVPTTKKSFQRRKQETQTITSRVISSDCRKA